MSTTQTEIFISYAWGGESEDIVNKIYPVLVGKGFHVIRDKVDLGFKGNIKEFMVRIGEGKAIVVVISDKYLKSENCMFEMLEIHRNKNTWNRIFPIVLPDARIYDEIERIDYLVYWDNKVSELNTKIKTIQNAAGIGAVIEKINQYTDIRRFNDEIMDMLRNMNTLTPDMHKNGNFEILTNEIAKLLGQTGNTIHLEKNEGSRVSFDLKPEAIKALNFASQKRIEMLNKDLERNYKLLDEYTQQYDLTTDARTKLNAENEIDKLNKRIVQIVAEMEKMLG